jgi:hypothetical protein
MEESVLWAIAIGTGMLGLLLLSVAGAVAAYWKIVAHGRDERMPTGTSRVYGGDMTTTEQKRAPANANFSNAQPAVAPSPWLWVKAWIFAILHAGTVSVVLGGITFFEDLAKASAEMQSHGTVTFPKQLLPGTLSGPASRNSLSQPSGKSRIKKNAEDGKPGRPGATPSDASGWEVVDLVK